MATSWTFAFSKKAQKQFDKLTPQAQSRIKKAVLGKLIKDPEMHLISLHGDLSDLYKFRVGEYRLLCSRNDQELHVLVVKVKHRKDVYND